MSKLSCRCGHVIVDQTNDISYKARFIRDKDWSAHKAFSSDVAAFIKAIGNGQRQQWIQNYFYEGYPGDISDSEVVHDIASMFDRSYEQDMFQCENCGRIAIQKRGSNIFEFFRPEGESAVGIFDVR